METGFCLKYFGLDCVIVNCVYELPHKLSNNLRLGTIVNQEMEIKSQNFVETKGSFQFSLQI